MTIINKQGWIPSYHHQQDEMYILLTSLNLGGAEKIVSDHLWDNYYSPYPKKVTLIVIYEKDQEHSIPPDVNVVKLHSKIENGYFLFKQIAFLKKPLICHLINDILAMYLIDLGVQLQIVVHNDRLGWANSGLILNHKNVVSIIAVCQFVKNQLQEITNKPIYCFRHQISYQAYKFNSDKRIAYRKQLKLNDYDILIGMTGRICPQKNYFLAIDVFKNLLEKNSKFKMVILGGFVKEHQPLYIQIIKKINEYELANHIFLPGFKTDVKQWLNAFDIALNTSYFEGLSMATQEFMLNGLPVVASSVSGQPEIFDIQKQLELFEYPLYLRTEETNKFSLTSPNNDSSLYPEYVTLVETIGQKIQANIKPRFILSEEHKFKLDFMAYSSHYLWNILNFIDNKKTELAEEDFSHTLFITQDLNLGGAQRSLTNLLTLFSQNNLSTKLAVINQSSYDAFYQALVNHKVDVFLAHKSSDVFDICTNLFKYIQINNIQKIVFWNLDYKIKFLMAKFYSHIQFFDVSPGDYTLNEINLNDAFANGIYFNKDDYFNRLNHFVSKFKSNKLHHPALVDKTTIIPNGVYFKKPKEAYFHKKMNKKFKIIVCGRLAPQKFIHEICQAVSQINYPIELNFYGNVEPVYLDYYEKVLSNFKVLINKQTINFLSPIEDVSTPMREHDLSIILGVFQGCPNTVLEAASIQLPVITNDSGGSQEIINNNKGILLKEVFTVEDIVKAINFAIDNYEMMVEKAKDAYTHVLENFSMEQMATAYYQLLTQKNYKFSLTF